MRLPRTLLTLTLGLLAIECHGSSMTTATKHLAGRVGLRRLADQRTFALVTTDTTNSSSDLVGGAVLEIGWTPDMIVAVRRGPSGDTAFVVLVPDGRIVLGPTRELNWEQPPGFRFMSARDAWKELP
jgi:hypothetical protein